MGMFVHWILYCDQPKCRAAASYGSPIETREGLAEQAPQTTWKFTYDSRTGLCYCPKHANKKRKATLPPAPAEPASSSGQTAAPSSSQLSP